MPLEISDSMLAQIQKLLQLAEKNSSEHEAASAMAKAQELLQRHNLTYEAVTNSSVGSGAREKTAVEGGYYDCERALWRSVAELNFCLYWYSWKWNYDRVKNSKGHRSKRLNYHNVVGRRVNVATTKVMAGYLLSAATRLTHERVRGDNDSHRFSNWANSYRRGIVDRVCRRLRERRSEAVRAEEAARAKEERAKSEASTSTAVTLMVYVDSETDANLDFVHGEGYSAKRAAQRAEAAAVQAKEADRNRRQRERYTRWAAANPEKAAEIARKTSKVEYYKSRGGRSSRASRLDAGGYWSGYDAGESVSIDQQVDEASPTRRLKSNCEELEICHGCKKPILLG